MKTNTKMNMHEKLGYFLENYENSFFVGSLVNEKVIYINKNAKLLFGVDAETCDFEKIFERNSFYLEKLIKENLKTENQSLIYGVTAVKENGETFLTDLHLGYFNEEKTEIYLDLIPQKDNRMEMTKQLINESVRAEAILELDELLSIYHCNKVFSSMFCGESGKCLCNHENKLGNAFPTVEKTALLEKIRNGLKHDNTFYIEVEIKTCDGERKWLSLELQKRMIDDSGYKLLCFMSDIEEQVTLKEEYTVISQYFDAMQDLTNDILYRVDVATKTLYHNVQSSVSEKLGNAIVDYPTVFIREKVIHPEDCDLYLSYLHDFYHDVTFKQDCTIRAALTSEEYQRYVIRGKKIFDNEGTLKFVIGAMVNVEENRQIQENYSMLNQYFTAMQTLSADIVYRIDVKTTTLHHDVESPQGKKLGKAIPDYVNVFIQQKIIHPDDCEKYLQYLEEWMLGTKDVCTLRAAIETEEYQWYNITGEKIFDENGDLVEVFGTMENIQGEYEMKNDYSVLNQYFSAMQDLSKDILFHIDVNTKTFYHSDPNAQSLGIPVEIPNYVETFIEKGYIRPEDADSYREYTEKLFSGEQMEYHLQAAVGDGVYEWFHIKSKYIYDEHGKPKEIFGKMENIQSKRDLERKATHDQMTELLNKVSFEEEVAQILGFSKDGEQHALIFIDLDDFKGVNDNLGHGFGDFLLTTVGKRLKRAVRNTDIVGRVGGDEFVVFLRTINSVHSAVERTELLLQTLQRRFSEDGKSITMKASLGIAIFPEHGTTYKELVSKSDIALYTSKDKGKNVVSLYTEEMEEY